MIGDHTTWEKYYEHGGAKMNIDKTCHKLWTAHRRYIISVGMLNWNRLKSKSMPVDSGFYPERSTGFLILSVSPETCVKDFGQGVFNTFYLEWTFMTGRWPWDSISGNEGQSVTLCAEYSKWCIYTDEDVSLLRAVLGYTWHWHRGRSSSKRNEAVRLATARLLWKYF